MQALDLTQGFAILAGADAQAGQAPEQAAGSEAFAALVQGLLAVAGEPEAIGRPEDVPAEPAASGAGLTAALDPVNLSVLLSLVAPAPGLHQAPAAQPTTDVPVATGDVSEAPTAAAGSRLGSVDSPTDPRPLHAGRSVDRPIVFERPYSPSPVVVSASQGLGSASPSSAVRDSIAPDVSSPGGIAQGVSSPGGIAQGVSSPGRIPQGVTSPDRSMAAPGPAAGREVPAPTGAASVLVSDPSPVSLAEGDPQPASLTEGSPSPGTPAADALTIDGAAPKAPKGPVPAPSRARGAVPRSAMSADAAAAALMTVATVTESIEASIASPAPPTDAHGSSPIETVAVPATPVRAMARDLARLSSPIIATSVVAATAAIGPGTGGPRQEAGQESNGNAGVPGADPVVSAPVVADSGWVAQAWAAVAAADVAGTPVPSSAACAPGAPATAVAAVPSLGAGVGDASLSVVTSTRARQIEALLGAGDPDRQNLHSIVRTIRVTGSVDGVSEARLRLQPEHLGQVVLNVRVEQGSVTAHFHAESPEARQWIESHQHELRSALRQQGLEVKELVVSADPDRRQQGRQDEPRERPRQRQRRGEPAAWDAPRFEVTV